MKYFFALTLAYALFYLFLWAATSSRASGAERPAPNAHLLAIAGIGPNYQILTESSGVRVVLDKKGAMAILPN